MCNNISSKIKYEQSNSVHFEEHLKKNLPQPALILGIKGWFRIRKMRYISLVCQIRKIIKQCIEKIKIQSIFMIFKKLKIRMIC